MTQNRPQTGDYAVYYTKYIALVPGGDFLEILESQLRDTEQLLSPLTDEQGDFRYASHKWSIKEILGHLSDAERIFSYRMLRIAREDKAPLAGFEQDDYVAAGDFNSRVRHDLMVEFKNIRGATIALVGSISPEDELRTGVANGNPVSVRALAYIIAGHAQRHLNLMRERRG